MKASAPGPIHSDEGLKLMCGFWRMIRSSAETFASIIIYFLSFGRIQIILFKMMQTKFKLYNPNGVKKIGGHTRND